MRKVAFCGMACVYDAGGNNHLQHPESGRNEKAAV